MTKIEVIRDYARKVALMEGFEIGAPLHVSEVTFIPILKPEVPRDEREYLTLSEALDENLCRIIEKGTEIAYIVFESLSELPILIEEGEIFQGKGTQDRIAVGTTMVEPCAKVEISVKCVHAPHALHSGAVFGYSGKCSRSMLKELRQMKAKSAKLGLAASSISQSRVWSKVSEETASETVIDHTKYEEAIHARQRRVQNRFKDLEFPKDTIGFAAVTPDGKIGGLEVHRSPRNFRLRKDGILESLESSISWEPTGKGSSSEAQKTVQNTFKKLSELKEEDALNQIEIDGLVINTESFSGEAFTTAFYSGICPECGDSKPRKKVCPACGFAESVMEELAYMSLL
ncbi:MAG: ARPP-1 family domain-containing protein [Promethearchaeota archaeon]